MQRLKIFTTSVLLMLLSLGLSEASAQEIRIIYDEDQREAYEAFDKYMLSQYTGQEEEFAVTINGNTYRFEIQFKLDRTFISAMQRAEAISFFGDHYIVCWFPGEDDPLYENLQPGIRKHFSQCFAPISFTPLQKKVYDPRKRRKAPTASMQFYEWNQKTYDRMMAEEAASEE